MEIAVYKTDGKVSRKINLPEQIFGAKWNSDLVQQVATSMDLNARAGTAHTKFRSEVSGTGKKPWKQKGTGQARHGSRRSPIWVGGGIAHGPRTEKDYSKKISKSMRRGALISVLSKKLKDGEIVFVEPFDIKAPKTKDAKEILKNLASGVGAERLFTGRKVYGLMAFSGATTATKKSFANLTSVEVDDIKNVSVTDVLNHKYLVCVDPEAVIAFLESKKPLKTK